MVGGDDVQFTEATAPVALDYRVARTSQVFGREPLAVLTEGPAGVGGGLWIHAIDARSRRRAYG